MIESSEAGNPSLLLFESVASAVNYLKLTNSATGNPVLLDGTGSDVDVGVDLRAKGDGNLRFYQDAGTTLQATIGDGLILGTGTTEPGAGNLAFADLKGIFDGAANEQLLFDQVASAVNYLQISNSATGNAPVLAATGSDANVGLILRNRKGSANNDALTINGATGGATWRLGDSYPEILLQVNAANAGGGSTVFNNGASAASDYLGWAQAWNYLNSVGGTTNGPVIEAKLLDNTSGSVDDLIQIKANVAGLRTLQMFIGNGVSIGSTEPTTWHGTGNLAFADLKGIYDGAGNEQLLFDQVASAVNYLQIANAATGNAPTISAAGDDANVALTFNTKGGVQDAINFNLGTTNYARLNVNSTSTADGGPVMQIYQTSSSPAANDYPGGFEFFGNDSGANRTNYGGVYSRIIDTTNTSEDAALEFWSQVAGSNGLRMSTGDGVIVGSGSTFPGAGNLAFADLKGIFDGAANEQLLFDQVTSAVNYVTLANAAIGNPPTFTASGSDTNIDLSLVPKGTGVIRMGSRTVANLPAAGTAGRRAFVTDANATTFASVVAGGGANGCRFMMTERIGALVKH